MTSCETCKHAKITHGEQIIKMDGMTIIQCGGTICQFTTGIKNISFYDGDMVCSSYEQRKATSR